MSTRIHKNWLTAFVDYAQYGEAPDSVYFWVGVSCIAAVLRRRVWLPMGYFEWIPNFYVIIVAPPGVIGKTTSIGIGSKLLHQVPGINFGPQVVTWQALVTSLAGCQEMVDLTGDGMTTQSCIFIEAGEFGTLLNPNDREMVDMLVHLWDGRKEQFVKKTKTAGDDTIINPCVNILTATTPDWIGGSFPEYLIGGGFTSRCIFVYAEEKARLVAYPGLIMPKGHLEKEVGLVHDLEHISQLSGQYKLDANTVEWGKEWYERHNKGKHAHLDPGKFGGYLARKQTHIHKLAMVIAAAQRDELIVTSDDLTFADKEVTRLENDMAGIYAKIGTSADAKGQAELVRIVRAFGVIDDKSLYNRLFKIMSHNEYVQAKDSAIAAGMISTKVINGEYLISAIP